MQLLPGAQQRLLRQIFRILEGAKHPIAMELQLATMRFGELGKIRLTAGARGI